VLKGNPLRSLPGLKQTYQKGNLSTEVRRGESPALLHQRQKTTKENNLLKITGKKQQVSGLLTVPSCT